MDEVVAETFDCGHGKLKVLFRFSGEPDDHVCRQARPGEGVPEPADFFRVLLHRITSVHLLEYPVAAGLDRKVDRGADNGFLGHRLDDFAREIPRVGGHEPQAPQPLDIRHSLQQIRKRGAAREIGPIAVDVLAQQGDVSRPVRDKRFHVPYHGFRGP